MATILVIDFDHSAASFTREVLCKAGFQALVARSSQQALAQVRQQPIDLVVLDLDCTSADPWSVAEDIRRLAPAAALLVLSATQRRSADIVAGLQQGADMYLLKPVEPRVLLAYCSALLRRPRNALADHVAADASHPLQIGPLTIHPAQRAVQVEQCGRCETVLLNRSEFEVLLGLARRAGEVVSTAELLDQIWGPAYHGDDSAIYARVYQIRKKLVAFPSAPRIQNVPRCGYRIVLRPVRSGCAET